jgi:hypothetical protein
MFCIPKKDTTWRYELRFPCLNNIEMAQVDKTKRQKVYDQISDAADDLLEELDLNVAFRKPLMWFFIDGQIKKLLAL